VIRTHKYSLGKHQERKQRRESEGQSCCYPLLIFLTNFTAANECYLPLNFALPAINTLLINETASAR